MKFAFTVAQAVTVYILVKHIYPSNDHSEFEIEVLAGMASIVYLLVMILSEVMKQSKDK